MEQQLWAHVMVVTRTFTAAVNAASTTYAVFHNDQNR